MARNVLIFDLSFMTYIYHSTPQASMYPMLISGWHKSRGDNVGFIDEVPSFKLYDIVYIVKDGRDLFHDPNWLTHDNVVPVGEDWKKEGIEPFYNTEWELAPPDNTIYWAWLDDWVQRYPKYNKNRLEHFYRIPHKCFRKGKFYLPTEKNTIIIDRDYQKYDPDFSEILKAELVDLRFAHSLVLDGAWEEVLYFIAQRTTTREYIKLTMNFENYDDKSIQEAIEIWNKYKQGRMVRINLYITADSHEEWRESLKKLYLWLGWFRMLSKKRIAVYPYAVEKFKHPRVLTEYKRWTGRSVGVNKNSLIDYMLYDGCRDTQKILDFLEDPYLYVQNKRQGTNKFKDLLTFAEEEQELLYIFSESYPQGAS